MEPDRCPNCDVDLQGDPIPPDSRHWYGGNTHFSRVIGISDGDSDSVGYWRCPDCQHEWEREGVFAREARKNMPKRGVDSPKRQ